MKDNSFKLCISTRKDVHVSKHFVGEWRPPPPDIDAQ